MGDLTTVTIANEGIESMLGDSKEFCSSLMYVGSIWDTPSIAVPGFPNFAKVQTEINIGTSTTYLHMGDDPVIDMAYNQGEVLSIMREQPELLEKMLNYMRMTHISLGQPIEGLYKPPVKYKGRMMTTFTLLNDNMMNTLADHELFCKTLHDSIVQGVDLFDNLNRVGVQKSRALDDYTIYVSSDRVYEMNPFSESTRELKKKVPEYFRELRDLLGTHISDLKEEFERYKKDPTAYEEEIPF